MKKTVSFKKIFSLKRVFKIDSWECWFSASIVDSEFIGTPREENKSSYHEIRIGITYQLKRNWYLKNDSDIIKVLFERGKEFVREKLKNDILCDREKFLMNTDNEETDCPYNLDNIDDPEKGSHFDVEVSNLMKVVKDEKNAQKIKVFISYAKEDRKFANRLYHDLIKMNINPWLNKKDILLGENWKIAIKKAISESHFFIALLSSNSVTKKGYVNKEIKIALEILNELPESRIFFLPLRLNQCEMPFIEMEQLQYIDILSESEWKQGMEKIKKTLLTYSK